MDWKHIEATGAHPLYDLFAKEIQKAKNDDRLYRLIRLENGLQALLVHDGTADNAAAALDVATGQLMDPDDMPGLAHFCEHMSFLGTEQYPTEGEYASYITANGGYVNAFTDTSNTKYIFSVSASALPGALDRFSTMFHSPLFTASATMRELQAVNSEHKKNDQDDTWRIYQVSKSLSRAGHVWGKFGNGNLESLTEAARAAERSNRNEIKDTVKEESVDSAKDDGGPIGIETRRRLVEWWNQQYCAGRMRLAVVGKESLDELTNMTSRLFSPIKNRGLEPYILFQPHPYGDSERGMFLFIKSLNDMSYLDMSFPIPYQAPYFDTKPADFIGHIVGYGGPNSLSLHLQNKGWIVGLGISSTELARGTNIFGVQVSLTPEGLAKYQDVAIVIFKYIRLLQTSPLPTFLHDEHRRLNEMYFRFLEKGDPVNYASSISGYLQSPYCPRERILSAQSLSEEFVEKPVREILHALSPENARIKIVSKNLDGISPNGTWENEKWYGTEYKVTKFDDNFIRAASEPNDIEGLSLPMSNAFIPTDLTVNKRDVPEPLKEPALLRETSISSLWYKKDDQFWVPIGSFTLLIKSPLVNLTPRHAVMTQIYIDLMEQHLEEYTYDAAIARLSYDVSKASDKVVLKVKGYNQKIPILLRCILQKIKDFQADPKHFEVLKTNLKQDLENFAMSEPNKISQYFCHYLLSNDRWTHEERLDELPMITIDDLQRHADGLFSRLHLTALVHGNINQDDALSLMDQVETTLKPARLAPMERILDRSFLLPKGSNFIWERSLSNEKEVNSCLSYYCHAGLVEDRKTRMVLALLAQIIREPLFKQLRTVEQLGYAIHSGSRVWTASVGLYFSIQSERDPSHTEARLHAFLRDMADQLRDLPDKEFQQHRAALIEGLEEKLQNLDEERSRFWSEISSGYNDFHNDQLDADCLRQINLNDVVALFTTAIHPDSLTRSKISVHLRSHKSTSDQDSALSDSPHNLADIPVTFVKDVRTFKSSLCLSKAATSVRFLSGCDRPLA